MPNHVRPKVTGARVFFALCLADRGSGLRARRVDLLREALRRTRAGRPFGIDARAVLPDHPHAVRALPAGDRDFATRWGAIKARFSMAAGRAGIAPPSPFGRASGGVNPALRRKGEGGLWQRRFREHHIRDEADRAAHLACCRHDPVKHGLVAPADAWPHSSIHRDAR